jgi:hypothetical protein
MRTLLAAVVAALLLPAAAVAGGWASAGVLNPPQGVAAGEVWKAEIEILQHGRRPMPGLQPAVIVGDERFPAAAVPGRPGVYTAEVVFPRSGRIEYRVDDGFTNVEPHTFAAVIDDGSVRDLGTATGGSSGGFPYLPVGLGALVALAIALAVTRRRRSALPA